MENTSNFNLMSKEYLIFCTNRKNLDSKTIKSYRIDLRQYQEFVETNSLRWYEKSSIERYIDLMHSHYKPKSVKRKIASIKAFFHYLEIEEFLEINPFHKIQIKYKEPFILPKTIPINNIEAIINYAYSLYRKANTEYSRKVSLRNILILELLFATGMRISELCSLKVDQIDFNGYIIKIYGKGSKERLIQICNSNIQKLIDRYKSVLDFTERDYFLPTGFTIDFLNNRYDIWLIIMLKMLRFRSTLRRICFDILLQLYCWKKMLIYAISSKCLGTVL